MSGGVCLYAGTQDGVVVWRQNRGGWDEISRGLAGGAIDAIAGSERRPERAFAGVAHDGLYRTEDRGRRWTRVLEADIRSVAVDPTDADVVYAGAEPVSLYRSEDGGDGWDEITSLGQLPEHVRKEWTYPLPPHQGKVRRVFVHPADPRIVYLCLEHGGIVRSLDRGASWEDVSGGIDYLDIHYVATLPHRFDRYYASTARGFFTSEDPARGWVRAENGFTRDFFYDLVFLPSSREHEPPTMLVATADQSPGYWGDRGARAALFRSFDCAQSWHRVGDGLPDTLDPMIWALIPHPADQDAVFAGLGQVSRGRANDVGGPGTIYLTRDRGTSWEQLDVELPAVRGLWAAAD